MRDYMYGEYLYNLRKSFKMSQAELGQMLGISNKAVSKWETGESKPALKQLVTLAKIYNVPLEELIEICNKKEKSIYKIVITGGPCAGKSTAMSLIQEEYTKKGYNVLFISETATELIKSGISYNSMSSSLEFQKAIFSLQLSKEKIFETSANNIKSSDKVLIVCDRGILDGKAYLSNLEYEQLLRTFGKSEVELRDNYDAVFHLVTAANGAEEFYTKDNNTARIETIAEAKVTDERTMKAWTGHPYFRIIDNSTGFNDKMKRLLAEISSFLGEPEPYEIERKFLIEMPKLDKIRSQTISEVDIIQTYLKSENEDEIRIRQRGTNGNYVYTKTIKRKVSDMKRLELEKRIGVEEYLKLLMEADTDKRQIRKTRYCLVYNNQYFELDIYPFWQDKAILEIELKNENDEFVIPPDIKVIKEVTNDESYKNSNLAKLNN